MLYPLVSKAKHAAILDHLDIKFLIMEKHFNKILVVSHSIIFILLSDTIIFIQGFPQ